MSNLSIKNLELSYGEYKVLKGIDYEIKGSESHAIIGASGKTSLLNCLSLIEDNYKAKRHNIEGIDVLNIPTKEKNNFRLNNVGMIFQDYNIISDYTVLDNIKLTQKFAKKKFDIQEINKTLSDLGILQYKHKPVHKLSGGEKQRVGIARMMLLDPKIILADEPTGALDYDTSEKVFNVLLKMSKDKGIPLIVVTHDLDIAKKCDKIYEIRNGILNEKKF